MGWRKEEREREIDVMHTWPCYRGKENPPLLLSGGAPLNSSLVCFLSGAHGGRVKQVATGAHSRPFGGRFLFSYLHPNIQTFIQMQKQTEWQTLITFSSVWWNVLEKLWNFLARFGVLQNQKQMLHRLLRNQADQKILVSDHHQVLFEALNKVLQSLPPFFITSQIPVSFIPSQRFSLNSRHLIVE